MSQAQRRYGGLTAEERDALRVARLRQAGRHLIGTQGYAATTIERLCATAGVSTRNFYQYYDGKEAAFIDLYSSIIQRSLHAALESLIRTDGQHISERIPDAFRAYFAPMVEDVAVARIAFVEIVGVSQEMERVRLGYRESLVQIVSAEGRKAVEKGEIEPRDFRFAAHALAGAATSVAYDWAVRSDREPVGELLDSLSSMAVLLLTGREPDPI